MQGKRVLSETMTAISVTTLTSSFLTASNRQHLAPGNGESLHRLLKTFILHLNCLFIGTKIVMLLRDVTLPPLPEIVFLFLLLQESVALLLRDLREKLTMTLENTTFLLMGLQQDVGLQMHGRILGCEVVKQIKSVAQEPPKEEVTHQVTRVNNLYRLN